MPVDRRLWVFAAARPPKYYPIKFDAYVAALRKMPPADRKFLFDDFLDAADRWAYGIFAYAKDDKKYYHHLLRGLTILQEHGLIKPPAGKMQLYRGLRLAQPYPVGTVLRNTARQPMQSFTYSLKWAKDFSDSYKIQGKIRYGCIVRAEILPQYYLGDLRHIRDVFRHAEKLRVNSPWSKQIPADLSARAVVMTARGIEIFAALPPNYPMVVVIASTGLSK